MIRAALAALLFVAVAFTAAPVDAAGSCPAGYRHLYVKTNSGPCVPFTAK